MMLELLKLHLKVEIYHFAISLLSKIVTPTAVTKPVRQVSFEDQC